MWSLEVFNELLPLCPGCHSPFDLMKCSPQILPCSHTVCLSCLIKDSSGKPRKSSKRRCCKCDKRFSSYQLNDAFAETMERIRMRRDALDSQSRRCYECEKRAFLSCMRQCLECDRKIRDLIGKHDPGLACVICMECCVDHHNGHDLRPLSVAQYADEKMPYSCSSVGSESLNSSCLLPPYRTSTPLNEPFSSCSSIGGQQHYSGNGRVAPRQSESARQKAASAGDARLVSSSSTSSGVSSGETTPNTGNTSFGSKLLSSMISRMRSGSVPPVPSSPGRSPVIDRPPPPSVQLPSTPHRSRRTTNTTHPITTTPQRPGVPALGTQSPSYLVPNSRATSVTRQSATQRLQEQGRLLRAGDKVMREECSPFYGKPPCGTELLQRLQLEGKRQNDRRSSLPNCENEYHRVSPAPDRKSPLLLPAFPRTVANLCHNSRVNMPRRDPRIRGGPSHLIDSSASTSNSSTSTSSTEPSHPFPAVYENNLPSHAVMKAGAKDAPQPIDQAVSRVKKLTSAGADKPLSSSSSGYSRLLPLQSSTRLASSIRTRTSNSSSSPPSYINISRSCECILSYSRKEDSNNNNKYECIPP